MAVPSSFLYFSILYNTASDNAKHALKFLFVTLKSYVQTLLNAVTSLQTYSFIILCSHTILLLEGIEHLALYFLWFANTVNFPFLFIRSYCMLLSGHATKQMIAIFQQVHKQLSIPCWKQVHSLFLAKHSMIYHGYQAL